ncbi:hypothetical protein D3C79_1092470 [compost metagenome]
MQPIVLDFLQPAAYIAYQVMVHMGMIIPAQIIAGHAIPKIHLLYDMKLTQQLQGTVHRRKSKMRIAVLHQHVDLFHT